MKSKQNSRSIGNSMFSNHLVYAHADTKYENVIIRAQDEYVLLQLLQCPQTTGEGEGLLIDSICMPLKCSSSFKPNQKRFQELGLYRSKMLVMQ
jgi:hypothetical protein